MKLLQILLQKLHQKIQQKIQQKIKKFNKIIQILEMNIRYIKTKLYMVD